MAKIQHDIKSHAITRAGFDYQDLVGLKYLIEFYRDKDMYDWVQLEAPDPSFAAIDDFVAKRKSDKKYVLKQVKFTVEPERDDLKLCWDWLLKKRPNGTSCLQKWCETVLSPDFSGKIHSAQLETNKVPDDGFSKALNANYIVYDKVCLEIQARIEKQLGSSERAKSFFKLFEFVHSQPVLDDLHLRLRDTLIPSDTDEQGWYILLEQVKRWATRKNQPAPDGKIHHHHLSTLLSIKRLRSINQQFLVPQEYVIPDLDFHNRVLSRIEKRERWTVIWGAPGRGKSTYLSNLIDELASKEIVCLRHHYFLSMSDNSTDRISIDILASSLMSQMEKKFPAVVSELESRPSNLAKWLRKCAHECSIKNSPLVLIVDGLDHVWRGRRDIQQMEHFFKYLSSVEDNLIIVVGTQKVADSHLPVELLNQCPKDLWFELPALNLNSVRNWVKLKCRNIEYVLADLHAVSRALYEISNGHPLHLIYTIEYSIRNNIILNEANIMALPECPEGDIEKYYLTLWNILTESSKSGLHLMAGSNFNWPSLRSVKSVLFLGSMLDELDDIDHLIERKTTEIVPFHGSIFAWVRKMEDHQERYKDFRKYIISWLETDAPEYWTWAYLWLLKLELGDSEDFLKEVGRDWALKSIQEGRPLSAIIRILDAGERVSFDNQSFGKAIELRSIKTRIYNGPSYQMHEYQVYQEAVWSGVENSFYIEKLFNDLRDLTNEELLLLSINRKILVVPNAIKRIHEEYKIRQKRLFASEVTDRGTVIELVESVIKFITFHNILNPDDILNYTSQFEDQEPQLLRLIFKGLLANSNVSASMSLTAKILEKDALPTKYISEFLTLLSSYEGFDLATYQGHSECFQSNMYLMWHYLKHGVCTEASSLPPTLVSLGSEIGEYGVSRKLVEYFKELFLASVVEGLKGGTGEQLINPIKQNSWLEKTSESLTHIGINIGSEIRNGRHELNFSTIYEFTRDIAPPTDSPNEKSHRHYSNFRIALLELANNCAVLSMVKNDLVSKEQMEISISSIHWVEDIWLETIIRERLKCFSKSAIKQIIETSLADINSEVTQFDERALKLSQLSCIAYRHDLQSIAKTVLNLATENVFGYGYRKDYWLWNVLNAVTFCAEDGNINISKWLNPLGFIVDKVDEFTDGDEVPQAKEMFGDLLIASRPDLLPKFYNHLISKEEWYTSGNILSSYLEHFDLDNPVMQAVANTFFEINEVELIDRNSNLKSEKQRTLVEFTNVRHGRLLTGKSIDKPSEEPILEEENEIAVSEYNPEQFDEFFSVIEKGTKYEKSRELMFEWVVYWDEAGLGKNILEAMDDYFKKNRSSYRISYCLDKIAELALKYEGRKSAFNWFVRSQIENNGWSRWQGAEERKARLEKVATLFPKLWLKFIQETSTQDRYGSDDSLVFGADYWVYFLLQCGEYDKAKEITDSMVSVVQLEMANQPIGELEWLI